MLETRVHILYCNLNPPENFRLSYQVSSFWCPNPITVSEGVGPDEEKEVKYIQLPNLPLDEYEKFLESNSETVPKIVIRIIYTTTIFNERLKPIDVGIATLKMNADLVYQNRPTWKWLNVKNQWNDKVCGKLFVQFSAKLTVTSLIQQAMVPLPHAYGEDEAKLTDELSITGSPSLASVESAFAETDIVREIATDTSDNLLSYSASPNIDTISGDDSKDCKRPSGIVRPFPPTPFPKQVVAVAGRRSFDSVVASGLTLANGKVLTSALANHDGKVRPKKSVSFRIKTLPRRSKFTSRNNLSTLNLNPSGEVSWDRKAKLSKIPVPVFVSSTNSRKGGGSSKLNTSMPV